MADIDDGYDLYYTERLWQLLPAVYRTADSDAYGTAGPLRELMARIGGQVAVVRRGIDRMWADQSVETCDDWAVPYIGDLLGVNLIAGLDAAGWRRDVAKTIHYRRRKGTPAVLEELAGDVTGWQVRLVEAYGRLGRTGHGLDPAIGPTPQPPAIAAAGPPAPDLRRVQGLVGALTDTQAGGYADLRSGHGAELTGTAFEEYFRTADVRAAHGATGWYSIPKLLVFLWRLAAYHVQSGTPVPVSGCPNQFVFDPTGRQVPLFLRPRPPVDDVDAWVPAREWEVAGRLTEGLLAALRDPGGPAPARRPYPDADALAAVTQVPGLRSYAVVESGTPTDAKVWPELGRFQTAATSTSAASLLVDYTYGFAGNIGAGPYDRDLLGARPTLIGTPLTVSGGSGLDAALAAAVASTTPDGTSGGSVVIDDSLTYTPAAGVGTASTPVGSLLIQAGAGGRPVIRLAAGSDWVFTGAAAAPSTSTLTLDGLLVSGGDLVLRGAFDAVRLTACTLDPGTAATDPAVPYATSADNRPPAPPRLIIEGTVGRLIIDHCVLGPIRTLGGRVQAATVTDSIVQALRGDTGPVPPQGPPTPVPALPEPPLPPPALALPDATVALTRVTVLGPLAVHRLSASDCILDDVALVDDTQHGCVRFTAWAAGSRLPRQYESAPIAPGEPLFTSRSYGDPGYGRLADTAGTAVAQGAENGSEMGAFCALLGPLKERGLLLKYAEYLPLGLTPVVIHVT